MSTQLEQLIRQIETLSPAERGRVLQVLEGGSCETPEEILDRKLRESGLVRHPPHRGPRRPNLQPVRVQGKPLSEQLIEERR